MSQFEIDTSFVDEDYSLEGKNVSEFAPHKDYQKTAPSFSSANQCQLHLPDNYVIPVDCAIVESLQSLIDHGHHTAASCSGIAEDHPKIDLCRRGMLMHLTFQYPLGDKSLEYEQCINKCAIENDWKIDRFISDNSVGLMLSPPTEIVNRMQKNKKSAKMQGLDEFNQISQCIVNMCKYPKN